MTARRLFKTYKPLVAVMNDGFHVDQFIKLAARAEAVSMLELGSALDYQTRKKWEKAGLITVEKRGLALYVQSTSKALGFLRCKSHAEAAEIRDHKRTLPPELIRKIKSFVTLLSVAVNGPAISIAEAKAAAALPSKGTTMETFREWEDKGWILISLDPASTCRKWLLSITPAGLEALGVSEN